MPFIKAKNGNVVEVDDVDLAARALKQGHEVFASDPSEKGAKKWTPEADQPAGDSE
jgi:hypothetical protein